VQKYIPRCPSGEFLKNPFEGLKTIFIFIFPDLKKLCKNGDAHVAPVWAGIHNF